MPALYHSAVIKIVKFARDVSNAPKNCRLAIENRLSKINSLLFITGCCISESIRVIEHCKWYSFLAKEKKALVEMK